MLISVIIHKADGSITSFVGDYKSTSEAVRQAGSKYFPCKVDAFTIKDNDGQRSKKSLPESI